MNEQDSKRDQRGLVPDGNADKKGKGHPHVFTTEGLEHFQYSPKVIVTVGLVSFVLTIIVGTIMGYKSALSEIDAGISNNRTLNKTLDKHEFEIQNIKEDSKELGSRLTDVERFINTRGKK